MRRRRVRAAVVAAALLLAAGLHLLPPSRAAGDRPGAIEEIDVLPEGDGREETFFACIACHDTALIRRSGLTRQQWDGLMDWMVTEHNMQPLEADQRRIIVGYLAEHFPPRRTRPGFTNPFLPN